MPDQSLSERAQEFRAAVVVARDAAEDGSNDDEIEALQHAIDLAEAIIDSL